ncbi:hypothetical protein GGD54_006304 [Rhizobium tropici]|nr:hypothetical protein [Rhizobium tropici]MBB5596805.1 hypothetical protein [Rhizobium tropici]MBB6495860.1 hypothetical protein [Rhizobium tropici]
MRLGHAPDAFEVRGVEIGGEAVDRIVGFPNHLLRVIITDDRRQRTERLFLRDPHRTDDVGDDGRLKKCSLRADPTTAAANHRPFFDSVIDMRFDLFQSIIVD